MTALAIMKVLRRDYLNLIVVGSGGTTRQLLGRLGESWEVTVIDVDADRLARAEKVRPVELVEGDGSSRVVLERAGLDNADALVAATADDDANLEACRIASETGLLRVFAVAADPDR
ncbi:MAG: NAD-binding protein, partial [Acidimicrobiia bacterium]|nr:NAD-binding protein [Acidimicrobiia bacterium]